MAQKQSSRASNPKKPAVRRVVKKHLRDLTEDKPFLDWLHSALKALLEAKDFATEPVNICLVADGHTQAIHASECIAKALGKTLAFLPERYRDTDWKTKAVRAFGSDGCYGFQINELLATPGVNIVWSAEGDGYKRQSFYREAYEKCHLLVQLKGVAGPSFETNAKPIIMEVLPELSAADGRVLAERLRGANISTDMLRLVGHSLAIGGNGNLEAVQGTMESLGWIKKVEATASKPSMPGGFLFTPEALLPTLSQLVLPEFQQDEIRTFIRFARCRAAMIEAYGMSGAIFDRTAPIALFHGLSGTGKTMAGRAIARELGMAHYQFPQVAGGEVDEIEDKLSTAFAEMGQHQGVYQWDEADALMLTRDGQSANGWHQFYTRIMGILLPKMETCASPLILTTNQANALDPAVSRRIPFQVEFPFPDATTRLQIWQSMWPAKAPVAGVLDFEMIAREFPFNGGEIRNLIFSVCVDQFEEGLISQEILLRACLQQVLRLSIEPAKPNALNKVKQRFPPDVLRRLRLIAQGGTEPMGCN